MHLELGRHRFDITTRSVVMGILTRPDDASFDLDAFLAEAEQLVADRADLLDVGRASGPTWRRLEAEQEQASVVSSVEALHARFDVPISVDTCRASVAAAAYGAGAVVGHDRTGFADPDYLATASAAGAAVVVTSSGPAEGVRDFVADRAASAEKAGIPRERIMVDAGLDAEMSEARSLSLLRASGAIVELGYPVCLSLSSTAFPGEHREATFAAHALGVTLGCRVLRTRDVRGARRVADVIAAILEAA